MSKLSELLTQAKAEDMSLREIARRAQKRGHKLTVGTASKYFRGMHGTPDEETLLALHEVLNIPLEDLRTAADLPTGTDEPYEPPSEANRLDLRQRKAVDEIIRLFAREGRTGEPESTTSTERDQTADQESDPEEHHNAQHQRPTMTRRKKRSRLSEPHAATSRRPAREDQE